jgi:hypothetical protein
MELFLEVRYILWSSRVALDSQALMLGENVSLVLNNSVPSSFLHIQNSITYYLSREEIEARIMRFLCFSSKENISDILTKPSSNKNSNRYLE